MEAEYMHSLRRSPRYMRPSEVADLFELRLSHVYDAARDHGITLEHYGRPNARRKTYRISLDGVRRLGLALGMDAAVVDELLWPGVKTLDPPRSASVSEVAATPAPVEAVA